MSPHSRAHAAARFGAVAFTCFLASLFGAGLAIRSEHLSVVSPAGGLLLGYLLVTDRRHWAGAALAAFVGDLCASGAVGHAAGASVIFAAVSAGDRKSVV